MDTISKIIQSLTEQEYKQFYATFEKNHSDKSMMLLDLARNNQIQDQACMEVLEIKPNAYFTLKSRLNTRIENFLLTKLDTKRYNLKHRVAGLDELVLKTEREILVIMLKKLEKDLIEYDMPFELIKVYKLLRNMHINHYETYCHYSMLYNTQIANSLSLDMAEELLGKYVHTIGEYNLSRDEELLNTLKFLKVQLQAEVSMNPSQKIAFVSALATLQSSLFIPKNDKLEQIDLNDIEDELNSLYETATKNDNCYFFLKYMPVISFLKSEFYNKLNLYKRETACLEELGMPLNEFVLQYDKHCYTPKLLYTILDNAYKNRNQADVLNNYEGVLYDITVNENHTQLFVAHQFFLATAHFHKGDLRQAAMTLNNLRNALGGKKLNHTQLEVKLFLSLIYALKREEEMSVSMIKSVQRQLRTSDLHQYNSASLFIKMINKLLINQPDKAREIYLKFKAENNQLDSVLDFLNLQTQEIK